MNLLVRGGDRGVTVTPESAGWGYVGFEAARIPRGDSIEREPDGREVCVVGVSGGFLVRSDGATWEAGEARETPFDGPPHAVYLPAATSFAVEPTGDGAEIGLCFAPAGRGREPRLIEPAQIRVERRGYGSLERLIHNILMAPGEAESLLVTEVLTPAGHWSTYPPHKHDRDAPPDETYLEETYYHRLRPERGFGIQRVYTDDGSLDEAVAFGDRDVVLVPRGYHTVSAPPGYELYYLNVMAGPRREWRMTNDPDHAWLLEDGAGSDARSRDS